MSCPNCTYQLADADKFCAECGQRTQQHRFSLGHILHEFFHAFTHADKGVLLLLRDLALRPGEVLRAYIVEFKRARYFNPFTMLLLVLGFNLLLNSAIHPYTRGQAERVIEVPARLKTEKARAHYRALWQRQQRVSETVEKRVNVVTLLALPIIAVVFWRMLRRSGLSYAEHLVAQVMLACFHMLVGGVLLPLALVPALKQFATFWGQLLLQLGYVSWAYYHFLNLHGFGSALRISLVTALSLLAWAAFSSGFIFLYIMFG
jgi:hypothetical protein